MAVYRRSSCGNACDSEEKRSLANMSGRSEYRSNCALGFFNKKVIILHYSRSWVMQDERISATQIEKSGTVFCFSNDWRRRREQINEVLRKEIRKNLLFEFRSPVLRDGGRVQIFTIFHTRNELICLSRRLSERNKKAAALCEKILTSK